MSGSLNKAQLIGNLGADPEVRTAQSGAKIVNLSIATSERWKDDSGERQERTEWHRVVIFNEKLGELVEKHLTKGSKVFVEGMIRTRKWQDKDGIDRYSTEVQLSPYNGSLIFLDRKPGNDAEAHADEASPAPRDNEPASKEEAAPGRRGRKARA